MGNEKDFRVTERVFSKYIDGQRARLLSLAVFFGEALPIVSDLDKCNERLVAAGRTDLVIGNSAPMMVVSSPATVLAECNNFTPKFIFNTKGEEIIERGMFSVVNTPVTEEELMQLRDGKQNSGLEDSNSHYHKPAFHRMLVLFPEFTVDLILTKTHLALKGDNRDAGLEPELYIAYQLMSKLVDTGDPGVIRDLNGEIDDQYLTT